MELVPYPGLPDLPRHLWKRVYTAEERAAANERGRLYYRSKNPPQIRPTPANVLAPELSRAKAMAITALISAGKSAPACLTREDRKAIVNIYLQSIEMSGQGMRYSVDHTYPIAGERYGVCGLHVPANLTVMALTENQNKGNRPHASWIDYAQQPPA